MSLPLRLVGLCLLSAAVLAHTTDATCSPTTIWTSNSLHQSPCLVASYLYEECAQNLVNIPAQSNLQRYPVPGDPGLPENQCSCSSVAYSVLAACSFCQGQVYPKWSFYRTNCTDADTRLSSWPFAVPNGTAIPAWALDDVLSLDGWDVTHAQQVASSGALDVFPPSSTTSSSVTSSTNANSAATVTEPTSAQSAPSSDTTALSSSPTSHSSTPVASIVGGVVGGLAALGIGAIGIALIIRRTCGQRQNADGTPRPVRPSTTRFGSSGSMTSRWVRSGGRIFSNSPQPVQAFDHSQVTAYPLPAPTYDANTMSSGRVAGFTHNVPEV